MDSKILESHGIDYQKGLTRCMDDEEFYASLLAMFLDDDAFYRAKAAYEKGDLDALFRAAHELKGACGNADMTELYAALCPLVEELRAGNGRMEKVAPLFAAVDRAYARSREGITLALAK